MGRKKLPVNQSTVKKSTDLRFQENQVPLVLDHSVRTLVVWITLIDKKNEILGFLSWLIRSVLPAFEDEPKGRQSKVPA